jgi:hypothetical protein
VAQVPFWVPLLQLPHILSGGTTHVALHVDHVQSFAQLWFPWTPALTSQASIMPGAQAGSSQVPQVMTPLVELQVPLWVPLLQLPQLRMIGAGGQIAVHSVHVQPSPHWCVPIAPSRSVHDSLSPALHTPPPMQGPYPGLPSLHMPI